jgi:hypothetical protein
MRDGGKLLVKVYTSEIYNQAGVRQLTLQSIHFGTSYACKRFESNKYPSPFQGSITIRYLGKQLSKPNATANDQNNRESHPITQ